MELPESNNISETNYEDPKKQTREDRSDETFDRDEVDNNYIINKDDSDGAEGVDQFSDEEICNGVPRMEIAVAFKNAAFTWGKRSDMLLEVDDLDIPAGK